MVTKCTVILSHYMHVKSLQQCLTLCNPMNCSPPGFSVHGILQARILEWVAMSSSFVLPDTGVESLCCIPENNVMLYVYHASTLKNHDMETCDRQGINLQNLQTAHIYGSISKKQTTQSKNWAEGLNRQKTYKWPRGTRKDAQHHCFRGMQIKTTMSYYYLTLVRMAIIKKPIHIKCWRECGEKETLLHCCWECKLVQTLRTEWRFLEKLKIQQSHYSTYIQRKLWFEGTHAPQYSLQCCLQQPRHGSNLNVN